MNHKYFVLFCAYHAIACIFATVLAFSWVHFCATTGISSCNLHKRSFFILVFLLNCLLPLRIKCLCMLSSFS